MATAEPNSLNTESESGTQDVMEEAPTARDTPMDANPVEPVETQDAQPNEPEVAKPDETSDEPENPKIDEPQEKLNECGDLKSDEIQSSEPKDESVKKEEVQQEEACAKLQNNDNLTELEGQGFPQSEERIDNFRSALLQIWEQIPAEFRRKPDSRDRALKKSLNLMQQIEDSILSPQSVDKCTETIYEILKIQCEDEVSSAQQKAEYEDQMAQKLARCASIFRNLDDEFEEIERSAALNQSLKKQHQDLETLVNFLESKESQVHHIASKFKNLVHDISTLKDSHTEN